MVGNSLNLVELIKGYLTGDFKDKISSVLGESREKTQLGINAAVPGLLSGLDNAASSPEGARRLASTVDSADDSILSNVSSMFETGSNLDLSSGALQSILGMGGLSELTGNIGRASGMSGKVVSTLISFLVPIVFGALKRLKVSGGLDAAGLSSLLATQRGNIAAAMPETMREARETPSETAEEAYGGPRRVPPTRAEETYMAGEPRRSPSWILPLAIIAGLLGLIWYAASRSAVRAGRDDNRLAEQTRANEQMNAGRMSFDQLRAKYQTVIQQAQSQGVQISSLSFQNGKLIVKGTAPSLEAANNVWNEIKRVNPNMDDIDADIQVPTSQAQPAQPLSSTSENTNASNNEQSNNNSDQSAAVQNNDQAQNSDQAQNNDQAQNSDQAQNGDQAQSPEQDQGMLKGSQSVLPRAKPSPPPESSLQMQTHPYVVKRGDTLASISKEFYGNTGGSIRIYNQNRDKLANPNSLEVGQTLEIPIQ
jgi:LysM repeat protein